MKKWTMEYNRLIKTNYNCLRIIPPPPPAPDDFGEKIKYIKNYKILHIVSV